ncbi:MAG: LamG domain-containing protein [Chromatiaceae bacterium]|nr:LamG domain-containing protein [Chromatiaceae bacterium]
MATISGEVRDDAGDLVADVVVRAYRRDTGALLVSGLSGDGSEEVPGDADWDDVVLLLHFDGTDGSTTFTDSSGTPKTITAGGNAHIEADQVKYGDASGAFDGTGDYLRIPYESAFDLGAGDFTIEAWVYVTAYRSDTAHICGTYTYGAVDGGTNNAGWQFGITSAGKLKLTWGANSAPIDIVTSSGAVGLNAWKHVCAVRSGTTVKLYINGANDGTATYGTNIAFTKSYFYVGSYNRSGTPYGAVVSFAGYMDELRLTVGTARNTTDFTVPDAAFIEGTIPAKPLGEYTLTTAYTGEVQVTALDPAGGTTFNDLILRTTPV